METKPELKMRVDIRLAIIWYTNAPTLTERILRYQCVSLSICIQTEFKSRATRCGRRHLKTFLSSKALLQFWDWIRGENIFKSLQPSPVAPDSTVFGWLWLQVLQPACRVGCSERKGREFYKVNRDGNKQTHEGKDRTRTFGEFSVLSADELNTNVQSAHC